MSAKRLICVATAIGLIIVAGIGDVARADFEESEDQRNERMAWWREARFGMFIHWGVYSIPAGEWNGRVHEHISEWLMANADIPVYEYAKYPSQFNPSQFNAAEWVQLAKQAGMKYLVITSKHHDGFSMFDTKASDFDIVDATPYGKDPIKELSEECKKAGIRFCIYYSILDWHHPSQFVDYGKIFDDWEGEDTREVEQHGLDGEVREAYSEFSGMKPYAKEQYRKFMKTQLEELIVKYDPGVLWFDGGWTQWWTPEDGQDMIEFLRALNPELIINNRVAGSEEMEREVGDFLTPEQYIPQKNGKQCWETCMTMNDSWGYKRSDKNWKPSSVLIKNLVDIASKGSNFLLNVGPDEKGLIPEESVARLKDIGVWMDVNGEAIHGAQRWKVVKEGPNEIEFINSYDGEFESFQEPEYTPEDICFTAKNNVIYAICMAWPDKDVTIKSLALLKESEVRSVSMLGIDDPLEWSLNEDGLKIQSPDRKPCEHAFVFKIVRQINSESTD